MGPPWDRLCADGTGWEPTGAEQGTGARQAETTQKRPESAIRRNPGRGRWYPR
jgi:hypothetical protein